LVLAILNRPRIAQEAHAVEDILFGRGHRPRKQIEAAVRRDGRRGSRARGLLQGASCSSSYDPETAVVQGVGVVRYELLLKPRHRGGHLGATRAVGACPCSPQRHPAAAALMITDRIGVTIALSVIFGVSVRGAGLLRELVEQLPTGRRWWSWRRCFLFQGW